MLGASNACLVGENPTCSVPAYKGCEGLWSYDCGHAQTEYTPPHPLMPPNPRQPHHQPLQSKPPPPLPPPNPPPSPAQTPARAGQIYDSRRAITFREFVEGVVRLGRIVQPQTNNTANIVNTAPAFTPRSLAHDASNNNNINESRIGTAPLEGGVSLAEGNAFVSGLEGCESQAGIVGEGAEKTVNADFKLFVATHLSGLIAELAAEDAVTSSTSSIRSGAGGAGKGRGGGRGGGKGRGGKGGGRAGGGGEGALAGRPVGAAGKRTEERGEVAAAGVLQQLETADEQVTIAAWILMNLKLIPGPLVNCSFLSFGLRQLCSMSGDLTARKRSRSPCPSRARAGRCRCRGEKSHITLGVALYVFLASQHEELNEYLSPRRWAIGSEVAHRELGRRRTG